ncbi:MAG: M48 family metallopeptidase [Clostridia bacterium]|nr:M48 family metallopeptidase [Clostridia bacterium]
MKAPPELIEYVCVHECCHLIHNNHSRNFYSLLNEQMPDWKKRKMLLNKF